MRSCNRPSLDSSKIQRRELQSNSLRLDPRLLGRHIVWNRSSCPLQAHHGSCALPKREIASRDSLCGIDAYSVCYFDHTEMTRGPMTSFLTHRWVPKHTTISYASRDTVVPLSKADSWRLGCLTVVVGHWETALSQALTFPESWYRL